MKILIIGLGNPILGDDGVGWAIAQQIHQKYDGNPNIEVDCLSLGGLSLMERMTGYKRVILIDSIHTGQHPIGTVNSFPLTDLPDLSVGHTTAAHDTSLRTALNVGRSMNISLPDDDNVQVVAIEAENVYDFSEELSPPVAAAIPQAVGTVIKLLT
jgi:hydrogenase maturation protease